MKNRFLGGVSFLPLFAPADKPGGGEDQPQLQLQLDPAEIAEHGDPDFEANDPGDIGTVANDGDGDPDPDTGKAKEPDPEPVKAEGEEDPEPKEGDEDEAEQLRRTVRTLGKRVGTLTKEKRELSAKLQGTIKPVENEPEVVEGDAPVRADFATKAEFDAAVRAEAHRQRAVDEFNKQCNAVEAKGLKDFGADKWTKIKANLGDLDDDHRVPMDLLSVALETDDPAKVLFVLGNDIEKATELMGMTLTKRAIAMDKIASAKAHTETPRSKAPPPVEPIGGKGAGDDRPSDRDSDEEWNRKEELREREKAKRLRAQGY